MNKSKSGVLRRNYRFMLCPGLLLLTGLGLTAWYCIHNQHQMESMASPSASMNGVNDTRFKPGLEAAVEKCLARLQAEDMALQEQCLSRLSQFIQARKDRSQCFADRMLTAGVLWDLLKLSVSDHSDSGCNVVLEQVFAEEVLSPEEIRAVITQTVTNYRIGVAALEEGMISALAGKKGYMQLTGQPEVSLPGTPDLSLNDDAGSILNHGVAVIVKECSSLVLGGVAGTASVKILSIVAARVGVQAACLSSGWVGFGIGLIAAIEVDSLLDYVCDYGHNPKDELARQARLMLDRINLSVLSVLSGDGKSVGLRKLLADFSSRRQAQRRRLLCLCLGIQSNH